MLKPNYEISFNKIAKKITDQQSSEINARNIGAGDNNALTYFYSFLLLDCIDNIQSDSNDTQDMNNDLNFLQTQWIY